MGGIFPIFSFFGLMRLSLPTGVRVEKPGVLFDGLEAWFAASSLAVGVPFPFVDGLRAFFVDLDADCCSGRFGLAPSS